MSLLPPVFSPYKRCLVYCGDDRCTCDCNPRTFYMRRGYTLDWGSYRHDDPKTELPETKDDEKHLLVE